MRYSVKDSEDCTHDECSDWVCWTSIHDLETRSKASPAYVSPHKWEKSTIAARSHLTSAPFTNNSLRNYVRTLDQSGLIGC
jgi:hypothetical protein